MNGGCPTNAARSPGHRRPAAGLRPAARCSELRLLDWTDLEEVDEGLAVRPEVNHEGPLGVPYGSNPATCPVRAVCSWRQCLI
ncbi:hypothetical protein ACIP41_36615, partial [Streptomyces sp. NPDC088816]